jgi:predicted DNA binding protein
MGYYDVPKRTGVEEIAQLLGKDKGTVGEQLRRAEKHVFNRLLA